MKKHILHTRNSMISYAKKCAILILVATSLNVTAANIPESISFQNLLENKDIAMGEGGALFQDSQGFMWFGGSNALIRYDGYEFRQIDTQDANNPSEKKAVKFVQHIFEDSNHTIWIATRTGLLQFNSSKEKLQQIPNDDSQETKITTSDVMRVVELPSGEILACSVSGLFVVDPKTLKYNVIVPDPKKTNWLNSKRVNTAFIENKDDIWLGTEEGLEKVNWASKTFTLYRMLPEHPELVPDNRVADIISDKQGKFWVATSNGLVHFDPITQKRTRYSNDPKDRYSIGSNDIWKLLLDSQGVLWIASDGGGVSVFDKDKERFINHKYEAGRAGSINSNQVRTVFEDKNGDIWVGNYPVGINFFDRSSAPIISYSRDISNPNSLSHNSVLSVQEDKNGNLWLGTDGGGLNFFNRETGEFKNFQNDPNDPSSINGNAVLSTHIDSDGIIWVGVWGGGFASYNPATNKFTRYPYDKQRKNAARTTTSDRLNSAPVWSIREDKNKDLWITTHTGGVSKYNRTSKTFTHYTHIDSDPESLTGDTAWTTFEDSKGNIWVGTSSGLNLFNKEKESFTRFISDPKDPTSLSNPSALTIFEDSKKRLWVGTDAGLNLFNPDTKNFTIYNKKSGFIDDTIRTVLEDSEGNIWVSTNNGFSSFNPETKKIKNYNRISGRLVGGFGTHSGVISSKGEIIFGGTNGLRIFAPAQLTENKTPPPIVLTDFKIFSDSVTVDGEDGILTSAINQTDKIELNYKKSMFVFSFSALNFRDTAKNKYAYKLEGFDTDWLDAGNQRTAKYTNLNPGKYVFKVKGSNNDGVWNEQGRSITITQLPPPWKTWWAYTLYALCILAVIAWFIYHQRRKRQLIEEQNKLLEIKVSERTAEVRQKSKDIQSMLSNMPQGLFTVEEGGTIHPEYSQYLESIFETKNIAGRKVNDLLFSHANIGSDALNSAEASIFAIIGEDEMNFAFNQSLLVTELEVLVNDKTKHLTLDWNPIIVDDVISKLMVSVRDVTQLKQVESAAREQKRKLEIISQLLNISAEKYLGFEESSARFIQLIREVIEANEQRDEKIIALMFRNMHTIKGNSRTLGFTLLSNAAHEIESTYTTLKASPDMEWNREELLADLNTLEENISEYANVYRTVLGRGGDSGSSRKNGFWMNNIVMDKIQTYVDTREIDLLKTFISRINAHSLEQNLADVIASLSSIASQLDKKMPVVTIEPSKLRIKVKAQELIIDIFSHILRNCVDHGLETAEERIHAKKDERGTIFIRPYVQQDKLHISIQDDGRGLNIDGLFKKGISLGIWKEGDTPTTAEIAQIMFHSGVTTKDAITDISGRGVGMDAVRQFLSERRGEATIKLHEEMPHQNGFVPFELIVILPPELFFESDEVQAEEGQAN